MKIDSLYAPDPYSGSILEPPAEVKLCYIDFPNWSWPNYSPRRPSNDDFYRPYAPPYQPVKRDEDYGKTLQEALKKLRGEPEYFTKTKDTLKFRLELAGFAKEEISVSIRENKSLNVSSKNALKPYNRSWEIPDYGIYNLELPSAQMSNGLLEIFFSMKKEESRVINIF